MITWPKHTNEQAVAELASAIRDSSNHRLDAHQSVRAAKDLLRRLAAMQPTESEQRALDGNR